MAKVYDIPADFMIPRFAEHLKKDKKIEVPRWSNFVKTGTHGDRRAAGRPERCVNVADHHGCINQNDIK